MMRYVGALVLALGAATLAGCALVGQEPCPVTAPNGLTPPGSIPSELYYGENGLWTALWPDGVVLFEPGGPGEIRADGSLAMKFPWWRGEGVVGDLKITGRSLDGGEQVLLAEIPAGYGQTGFQATGLVFPAEGCWEVAATVGDARLTFVTEARIAPAAE